MRSTIHYSLAAIALTIYGGQVCPFLETLTLAQLLGPILTMLALQYLVHRGWQRHIERRVPLKYQAQRVFQSELALFFTSGAILMLFNRIVFDFPLESGLKVVLGLSVLGYFIAIDLALERERDIAATLQAQGLHIEPDSEFMPLTRKVAWFASISVVAILSIVFLVINKDLDWLVDSRLTLGDARRAILGELAFVMAVMLPYIINTIVAYARNLRLFLDAENGVLHAASTGRLDGQVPVSSNDEFGLMADRTNAMVRSLRGLTEELRKTRDVTIHSLAILAETRDYETGAHILRTQRYVQALAEQLRDHPHFTPLRDPAVAELLFKSAPLHDIGKIGIPDHILLKPGRHTPEEFEIMKTHTTLGADALRRAEAELGEDSSFLRHAREIAEGHHERWDGSGYPHGLAGTAIPLSARLMALADVYDALISKRVYKPAFPHEQARTIIVEGRAAHFDPDVVDAFLASEQRFIAIAREFADEYTHCP
jgi:HD-GYP domain-containing protein (c-di-GMP phosphodiesterase class II)